MEIGFCAAESDAFRTQFVGQSQRIRRKLCLDRSCAIEPHEQCLRLSVIGSETAQLDKLPIAPLIRAPVESVGGNADEAAPGGALAFGKIAAELRFGVAELAAEIRFCFERGAPKDGIDTAPGFGYALLEMHVIPVGA